ncbi:hypothetical protein AB8989_12530, partial [Yersinia hibernica]
MKKTLLILGAMVLLQSAPPVESAGSVTGTLGATLTIITGCYVNDGTTPGGLTDAPRDKCAHFREINGIAAAFQYLQKNYNPT